MDFFVNSITFSLLGLHQVIQVSMLTKLKVDKKDIILKECPLNVTQAFEEKKIIFKM